MARANKFIKGAKILTAKDLFDQVFDDKYVFMHNRPMHPAWIQSMQLRCVHYLVIHGAFSFANLNPECKTNSKYVDVTFD